MKNARGWVLASALSACSPARAPQAVPEVPAVPEAAVPAAPSQAPEAVMPPDPTQAPELIVPPFSTGAPADIPPSGASFSIGRVVALGGGEGTAITARGSHIATLHANGVTCWVNRVRRTVVLPWIRVDGARWSADGTTLFAGPGRIDVARGTWSGHPAFANLTLPGPPGGGSLELLATSWSADGRHAAALLAWQGPRPMTTPTPPARVILLDLAGSAAPVTLPAAGASTVWIAGDRVVVGAPVVRVWTFAGAEIAALPSEIAPPHRIWAADGGPVLLIDGNAVRVLEPATWTVGARWAGPFIDAVGVPGGVVALTMGGQLRAACVAQGGVRDAGTAEIGRDAIVLAATGDGRLAITGLYGARVVPFSLRCAP
jgi:hypothetical protein